MKDMQNWQVSRKAKYDMETFDDVLVKSSSDFMDKAKADGKPFFIWHNTTRMHVFTYLPHKYQSMMNAKINYNVEEAGMAQLDDNVGQLLKHLEDIGEAENTIVNMARWRHDTFPRNKRDRFWRGLPCTCYCSLAG